jgi:hypothetical protein
MITFSFINFTGILTMCHRAISKINHLSTLFSTLPAILILGLCSCMIWQCSTCLIKFLASPTGAEVAFKQISDSSPIAITICNKDPQLDYSFPELRAVDVRQQPTSNWQTIWPADKNNSEFVLEKAFVTITHTDRIRYCKTINIQYLAESEVRLRHYYSETCNRKKMEVYLHRPGQFHAPGFALLMAKKMFSSEKNYILYVSMESMNSLPSADFNCSQDEGAQNLDSCLLAEAFSAANKSAGCLPKNIV